MTTPGGGGDRLEVSVVVDATGLAAQAQAKIDAATANVKAKIKADIDLRRLQAQTEAAAKKVAQTTKIQLQIGVDRKFLQESIRAAVAEASAERHTIKVGVDVDRNALDQVAAAGRGGSTTVNVDGDTTGLREEIDEVRQTARRNPIDVPVEIDPKSARNLSQGGRGIRAITGAMTGLQKAGFYAGLIQTLASAAVAAGGGLFAMAGAASQALGVLAAAPNIVGIAVQALGALFAGFSGIGGAVSALGQAQSSAGAGAARTAKAQEGAAKRIEKAQKSLQRAIVDQQRTARDGDRSVADARQKVSDVYARASDRVQSAERKVADAQKNTQRAQEALNRARQQATEQLKDYQLQLAGAALDEESATLAVARAREAWNKAMRNPVSTDLDRKEADLALRQAEQSLKEIQARNEDLRKEAADAATAGVEGSAAVVGAKEDLQEATEKEVESVRDLVAERVDAARDIGDAERDLADTIKAAYEANIDAAERVEDAQDALADAMQSLAEAGAAGAGGIDLVGQAMDKLSPAGQAFARFINDVLKPRMIDFRNAIQQELLPNIQAAITALITDPDPGTGLGSYLDVLEDGLKGTAKVMGETAVEAATLMSTPGFRADTATIMESNNRAFGSFGDAGISLINVLRNLAVAAGPLVERFAAFIAQKADLLDTFVSTNHETGSLATFFQNAGDRAAQLGDIIGNLIGTLYGLGQGGMESGDSLLTKFAELTQRWNDWANSDAGQQRIQEFFATVQPLFEQLATFIGKVVELFVKMGEDGGGAVSGMFMALNWIVDILTAIFNGPLGPIVSTFMQFAGVASVLSLVVGAVGGMISKLSFLITIIKQVSFALRLLALTNPFGLIIAAIAIVVGALVWAYNNVDWFRDFVDKAFTMVKDAIAFAFNWVKDNWPLLLAILTGPIGLAVLAITKNWDTIVAGVLAVRDWIVNAFFTVRDKVIAAYEFVRDKLAAANDWLRDKIVGGFTFVRDKIVGAFEWVRDRVIGAFDYLRDRLAAANDWLRDKIVGGFEWVRDKIVNALDRVGSFASGIWDGLTGGLKSGLNAVIRLFNSGIGAVNSIIRGVNHLPGVDIGEIPRIPLLAEGAIITRPTLAVVGEDGPEAVIPLSRQRAQRRAQLMEQAGLTDSGGGELFDAGSRSALGGWARLDSTSGESVADLVAGSGGSTDTTDGGGDNIGTVIEEGAVVQHIYNPVPETASGTLNSGLRRVAALGIFDSRPAS